MSETVGIVGGGVLGMTLALRLARQGHRVTILEGAPSLGGLAAPAEVGDFTWDRFYHVTLLSDQHLRELLADIGLETELRWKVTRTGVYGRGKLHSLSTSLEFLLFPLLSLVDKARLAATILHASRITDGRRLESIPVTEWLIRWSGRRTFERLWLPLLKSKLGENYRQASASFIWAIIARMYAARRSGLKREMFGYVDGGYARVLQRLRERLERDGVAIQSGCSVTEVRGVAGGALVLTGDGKSRRFDQVILTLPCSRIPALCPQLTAAERERFARPVYQGVVCASALLRRPLGGFYVTNITDPGFPFTAVIEMTALVDPARFGGNALVYLPRYLAQDDPFWSRSDHEIREEFLAGLGRMYPDLQASDVLAFEVSRVREVLAVSTLNYSADAMPPLHTSIEHVHVANSAQIANGTLNVNETVKLAGEQADALVRVFGRRAGVASVA
jgi:protoporphyrinogen oxidase